MLDNDGRAVTRRRSLEKTVKAHPSTKNRVVNELKRIVAHSVDHTTDHIIAPAIDQGM
jgi:hypothetical protein